MTRREYHRLYARRRRAATDAAKRANARTCPHGHGGGVCGGALETVTDGQGETRRACRRCERRLLGICRDCPARVEGRVRSAIRCAQCKVLARRVYSDRYRSRHPKEYRAAARRSYRNPDVRKRRNEYKRLWRKLNRDKVRAQKRRANLRGVGQRAMLRRREAGKFTPPRLTAERTCVTCPTMVRGRMKKCSLCKERERLIALDQLSAA